MKVIIKWSIIISLLFGCYESGLQAQTIRANNLIYLTENYPPHNFIENGKLTGVSVEILQKIWGKLGLSNSVEDIKLVPWARGMVRIKKEPNIFLFGMGYSPDRKKFLNWIGPYFSHSLYLIGKKNKNFNIKSLDEAKVYEVGVVREDIGHQMILKKGFPETSLRLHNNQKSLFKKLEADRIDLICFMNDSAVKGMTKLGLNLDEYENIYEIVELKSGFGMSKKVPKEVVDDFQTALEQLIIDGSVELILKKYDLR